MTLNNNQIPLAERCRPRSLDEFVGQDHLIGKDGVIRKQIENGSIGSLIRGHNSTARPDSAQVAVPCKGFWFYIDATDSRSKRYFWLLTTLASVRVSDSTARSKTVPQLTIPVNN